MRHNLKSSRREHPGSGTDSWGGSVIRLWNQKHLAEKTCALKGVKPQLICEKHLNTPSKPKLSPVRKILDNTVHPTDILCFFIFWWNLTKCNPCVYRAQSIAVLQRVKKSVCGGTHGVRATIRNEDTTLCHPRQENTELSVLSRNRYYKITVTWRGSQRLHRQKCRRKLI